jgi:hypothetical protein
MFCDNSLQRDVSLGPSQCHAAAMPCPSAAARKTHPSGPGSWKFPVPRLGTPRSHPNPHLGAKGATQTPLEAPNSPTYHTGDLPTSNPILSHLVTVWRNHSRPPLKLKQIVPLDCLLVGNLCKSNTPKSIYIRLIHVKLPPIPAKSSMSSDCWRHSRHQCSLHFAICQWRQEVLGEPNVCNSVVQKAPVPCPPRSCSNPQLLIIMSGR